MCLDTHAAEGWGLVPACPAPLPGHQDPLHIRRASEDTPPPPSHRPQAPDQDSTCTTLTTGGAALATLRGGLSPKPTPSFCTPAACPPGPRSPHWVVPQLPAKALGLLAVPGSQKGLSPSPLPQHWGWRPPTRGCFRSPPRVRPPGWVSGGGCRAGGSLEPPPSKSPAAGRRPWAWMGWVSGGCLGLAGRRP